MIMSLCKKGIHSFLGFANLVEPPPLVALKGHAVAPAFGFGLCNATDESRRGPNVVESTALYSPPPPAKKDPPESFVFVEEVGGPVFDGLSLTSCTESLGFESSDSLLPEEWCPAPLAKPVERTTWREETVRRREKTYPPPISSLNHKGQRSFYFRPVRTEGRLELEEVRIDRLEILHASREDGRLRLELIINAEDITEKEEACFMEEEEEVLEEEEEEEEEDFAELFQDETNLGIEKWKIPMSSEGFGIGRCYEALNHHSHHHHNFHDVWRQPCVPTR